MPPKKPSPATSKGPSKTAVKTTTAKPGAKPAAKPAAKAEAKPAAPPAPAPIVFTEMSIKEMPKRMVEDDRGELKAAGKWPCVIDTQGLSPRFLRHRDVNMLTTCDSHDMEPEMIRKALIGAIKFGKPFILDMMETDMWEMCVETFDKIQPNLMETLISRDILEPDTYIQLYKDGEDDVMYKNKFDYNVAGFTFMITTQVAAPNETMLRKMFPVKIV